MDTLAPCPAFGECMWPAKILSVQPLKYTRKLTCISCNEDTSIVREPRGDTLGNWLHVVRIGIILLRFTYLCMCYTRWCSLHAYHMERIQDGWSIPRSIIKICFKGKFEDLRNLLCSFFLWAFIKIFDKDGICQQWHYACSVVRFGNVLLLAWSDISYFKMIQRETDTKWCHWRGLDDVLCAPSGKICHWSEIDHSIWKTLDMT